MESFILTDISMIGLLIAQNNITHVLANISLQFVHIKVQKTVFSDLVTSLTKLIKASGSVL